MFNFFIIIKLSADGKQHKSSSGIRIHYGVDRGNNSCSSKSILVIFHTSCHYSYHENFGPKMMTVMILLLSGE